MEIIDLDDQIRWMAAIIYSGKDELTVEEAVDMATAIHQEVEKYDWSFHTGRTRKERKER